MLFKHVSSRSDLVVGQRYINTELHRIYELVGFNPIGSMYFFENIEDREDSLYFTFKECINVFRKFTLSEMELKVLLCSSMLDFLELMFREIKNNVKGEEENGKQ